jgi:SAM-dependent methyltransferase
MIRTQISSLPPTIDVNAVFPHWIIEHCNQTSRVLEVGAGKDRNGHAALIQPAVGELVGVDPDAAIAENPHLDARYQLSLEEFAREQQTSFDCLYAAFVLEHVAQPAEFLAACRRLLKPGGMLFGLTPNLWHYFGSATRLSASLGIEDWLLERLIGREHKHAYHFPTAYRLNSLRTLRKALQRAGFEEVEFRYCDPPVRFRYVLPGPLRWFPQVYSRIVYALRLRPLMGMMMFRATLGPGPEEPSAAVPLEVNSGHISEHR